MKRLEKLGYIKRTRPEENERKLFLSLTKEGMALKNKAKKVPQSMSGCIPLPAEDLLQLKQLLDKALAVMPGA
ncbi:MAG: hypothetical protein IJR00_11635 [Lachnospiraceae bacterium]|nr:hypothetical protein [Lachnospiraceae bacterium]